MSETRLSRREFVRRGAGAALLLPFIVGGCEKRMTPAEAAKTEVPLRTLTIGEGSALRLLGDLLVPGSSEAGLVHYIDHQLSAPAGESMLMIKYLGVPAPFTDFYRGGLKALSAAARQRHGADFGALTAEQSKAFVADFAAGKIADWQGPPLPLFYFVVRTDAIDVVYGTERGFESLGVPYMPHIVPPSNWGA
jgi:hypothetical protein